MQANVFLLAYNRNAKVTQIGSMLNCWRGEPFLTKLCYWMIDFLDKWNTINEQIFPCLVPLLILEIFL